MRLRNIGDRRSKKNLVLVPPRKRINHVFECCALCSLLGGNGIVYLFSDIFRERNVQPLIMVLLFALFCTIVEIYFWFKL